VYGDPVESFYQDGHFFDGTGKYVRSADGSKPVEVKEPVAVVEQTEDPGKADRIKALQKLAVPKLRKLAEEISEATGTDMPESGKGAKARYVKYIADNTSD
jgi:hypothetical protein